MIIGVDVDGVVADLGEAWLTAYNRDYNDDMTQDKILTWAIHEYVNPTCGRKIYNYLTPELYDSVKPIEGALEGVLRLREMGHRVVFVTSTPRGSEGAKLSWLLKHGFLEGGGLYGDGRVYEDYIECSDKTLVAVDVLVDDRSTTIESFPGHGILFHSHHNGNSTAKLRGHSWGMVCNIIEHDLPITHITEKRCPNQAREFKAILDKMYRTHLDKNADYSPANILGTGELGLATRIYDKCIRYLNLTGFDIDARLVAYIGPKIAKNESIDDTLLDMAVYSIIGLLLRKGAWGN